MKITAAKIKKELEKDGWQYIDATKLLLIKDVIKIIDAELLKHKNISIKK